MPVRKLNFPKRNIFLEYAVVELLKKVIQIQIKNVTITSLSTFTFDYTDKHIPILLKSLVGFGLTGTTTAAAAAAEVSS